MMLSSAAKSKAVLCLPRRALRGRAGRPNGRLRGPPQRPPCLAPGPDRAGPRPRPRRDRARGPLARARHLRARARAAEAAKKERAAEAAAVEASPRLARETGKIRNPLLFERLERRIMEIEGEVEAVQAAMLAPENYASAQKMKDLQADEARLKAELADAYEQWENWQ